MSDLYNTNSRYKALLVKKKVIGYTDKFENFLSVIITMLATVGILRTILQVLS